MGSDRPALEQRLEKPINHQRLLPTHRGVYSQRRRLKNDSPQRICSPVGERRSRCCAEGRRWGDAGAGSAAVAGREHCGDGNQEHPGDGHGTGGREEAHRPRLFAGQRSKPVPEPKTCSCGSSTNCASSAEKRVVSRLS